MKIKRSAKRGEKDGEHRRQKRGALPLADQDLAIKNLVDRGALIDRSIRLYKRSRGRRPLRQQRDYAGL